MAELIAGEHYGQLQEFVDRLYEDLDEEAELSRFDVITYGSIYDIHEDLQEVLSLLPTGKFSRLRLCSQLNSIISSHSWSFRFGTVE